MHPLHLLLPLAGLTAAQSSMMSSMMSSDMSMSMSMTTPMPMSGTMSMPALISATAMAHTPQKISVGSPSGGLVFQPNVVVAPVGAMLEFHFYPKNHSVVSGPYAMPCQADPMGVYSGFVPVSTGESPTTFTVMVNSTDPMWLYCSQEEHCQKGMAMVVNPPDAASGDTLDKYLMGAANAMDEESLPHVQGGVLSSSMGAMTPTPTPTMGSSSGGMGGASGGSSSKGAAPVGEPNGLIAGALVAALGWFL